MYNQIKLFIIKYRKHRRRVFMKKNTKKFLFFTTAALAGMYAYNQFVASSSNKNMLSNKKGAFYSWKQGNIFYTKSGNGSPVLLIHDTDSASSSVEWAKIIKKLEKDYTVYAIDLLGCGLSDKPGISYTNYMYVQLITSFIKDIIKEKTDVVTSNMSASFVIMANHMDDTIINKMILINPVSLNTLEYMPDQKSKIKQTLINLPLVGTFIYNILTTPCRIEQQFHSLYYAKSNSISPKTIDAYNEAAHTDNSRGKYLYSSMLANFMNADIRHAILKIDKPVYIIESSNIKNHAKIVREYQKLNAKFEVTQISNCKLYPQLENPEKIYSILKAQLRK